MPCPVRAMWWMFGTSRSVTAESGPRGEGDSRGVEGAQPRRNCHVFGVQRLVFSTCIYIYRYPGILENTYI